MPTTPPTPLQLIGRSSSHFTRVARICAHELNVSHQFRPILEIGSLDPAVFGENPALKMPILVDEQGPLFGTENICRELLRKSGQPRTRFVMRGDLPDRAVANAEELTLHVMASEVSLIMGRAAGAGHEPPPKLEPSMRKSLEHLERGLHAAVAALPSDRGVSFLEVTLFCAVTHLTFREVMDVSPFAQLAAFCAHFGERESAQATPYRFDVPSS